MRTGTFISQVESDGKIIVPLEIRDRLDLIEGEKVEILLKKIRTKRFEVSISKNPLYKLLVLSELKKSESL
jgi:bifunctional DNA-binding transcriptional regulator/antitoxin component of YhaV-PrlF toxin-antitoxin module